MAIEVYAFAVTVPAGTPQSALFRQSITMPVRKVDVIEWRVPPGPSGLMGFAVTMGGVTVLPTKPNTFIVADDEHAEWSLTGLPDSGAWQVSGYNTGVFDHTVYLRWLVDVVTVGRPTSLIENIDLSLLSSAPGV